MKTNKLHLLTTISGLLLSLNAFSQNVDLGRMSKADRETYLTDLAIEVTKTHGSGYYREDTKAIISEMKKFKTTVPHYYSVLKKPELMVEKIVLPNCRLKNFYRIGDGVFRSDQPSYICFRELEQFGIKEVLNLRNRHNDNDEARGTAIRLHRLRTKASRMKPDDLIEALKIIRDRQGPVLIHCWHGSDRTGAVCAMYRIVFQGINKEQAIHEMVDGRFGFHMIFDDIIDVIDQIDINAIRQELNLYL